LGNRAFRWTAAGGMRDLRDELVNDWGLGSQLSGWTLQTAYSCSASGQVIVGQGTDPAGQTEAWIARVGPAPPTVVSTVLNGGVAQRSIVRTVTVNCDSLV